MKTAHVTEGRMKFTTAKLGAYFMQRAGSKLRAHTRHWKLRRLFEVGSIHVSILPETRFADVHQLLTQYTVVLTIEALRQEFLLRELVALGSQYRPEGWAGSPSLPIGTRYLVECAEGKKISVELALANPGKHSLTPRSDGGRGFEIMLELRGSKLWPNENGSRPGRQKKSSRATRSRR